MKAIILILISIALMYGIEVLFWASLINDLDYLIFNYMKAYIIVTPAIKKYEVAYKQLVSNN